MSYIRHSSVLRPRVDFGCFSGFLVGLRLRFGIRLGFRLGIGIRLEFRLGFGIRLGFRLGLGLVGLGLGLVWA